MASSRFSFFKNFYFIVFFVTVKDIVILIFGKCFTSIVIDCTFEEK